MRIAFHTGGLPFNGKTINEGKSLGGSETASYYMAKELAKLGHEVFNFTNCGEDQIGTEDDVTYEWVGQATEQAPLGDRFHYVMQVPHDVVVIQRNHFAFRNFINSKLNIWWLHDIALFRFASLIEKQLFNVDQIFTVSKFHRNQVSKVWDLPRDIFTPVKNGVDYSMTKDFITDKKEQKHLCFAARPERGLNEIVKEGGLAEMLPDYTFHICTYKNVPDHIRSFYEWCWNRCEWLPNVINEGFLSKPDLYKLLAKCQLYIYPTTFEDTSNIMILEANAVGTPFIGLDKHAALQETGADGGCAWVNKSKAYQYGHSEKTDLCKEDLGSFADTIKNICTSKPAWDKLHEKALSKRQSWKDQAKHWDKIFKNLLSQKTSNKYRLYKHFEKMSDIEAIGVAEDNIKNIKKYLPDVETNYGFFINGAYQKHYDKYYEYEENRGVKYGPEDLTNNPRFEHTFKLIKDFNPESILDYGCAHGHYTMNIVNRGQPDNLRYILGVDFNLKNIGIAHDWLAETKHQLPNLEKRIKVDFLQGEVKDLNEDQFELILLCEILEHVADPKKLVYNLKNCLKDDGHFLITVPYGPWEAIGYKLHPGWRAHVRHFEREDLKDIFGKQKDFKMISLPYKRDLGHFIITFKKWAKSFGKINYRRKFKVQSPQETVSACLIAKDAKHTLGKTLKSIEDIADEIIIGVDKTSTEDQKQQMHRIGKEFNAQMIAIDSPLEVGFDAARNCTIKKAKMDWIFWIDADETLEQGENLFKYIRKNCFNGFGIKQHHYAVEPAALFKTDFPCRLFRNRKGVKFLGFVHEHPEQGINEGVTKSHIIEDVAIMHTGYTTDAIRRKRFQRNFPMIKKDRELNPNRHLGVFLMVRDIAHLIKYTFEELGTLDAPQIKEYAQQGIDLWEQLLETKNIRLIGESIPFYSDCVGALTGGNGIEFSFSMASAKQGASFKLPHEQIIGHYRSNEDIVKVLNIMVKEMTKAYEKEYF